MLDIGIPEIPIVDSFALFIGNISVGFRERFRDRTVSLQQVILKPAGDIEGRETPGRIVLDLADQMAGIAIGVSRLLQIAEVPDFPEDVSLRLNLPRRLSPLFQSSL